MTPFGWSRIDEIKVGDIVCSVDGGLSQVIGVYPQGKMDIYEFTFSDNAKTTATIDHLWNYWLPDRKRKKNGIPVLVDEKIEYENTRSDLYGDKVGTTQTLIDYLKNNDNKSGTYLPITPLCEPVQYSVKKINHWIDPYLLGLLIGDGTITQNTIKLGTKDVEIKEYALSVSDNQASVHVGDDGFMSLFLRGDFGKHLRESLQKFELYGKKSNSKFIPDAYLFASTEDRFALMSGLIDTDGYIDNRGHVSYTTVSEQLAKDVQHLARSLGCKATITTKEPFYTNDKGERVDGQLAYNVWINGKHIDKMSRLPRKRDRIKPFNGGNSRIGRRIKNIEKVGYDDTYCIQIDHWSSLYITDDFIVTHNTDLMLGLAMSGKSPHKKSIVFRRSYPEHKDFIRRAEEIIEETKGKFKGGNQQQFVDIPDGKTLEIGSVPDFNAAQKYKGRPHDLKLFDELSDISEAVYTFLIGWTRTTEENVPTRIVSASNPPMTTEGEWIIRRWRCWLDPDHKNPAEHGELRWFATLDGIDTELTPELYPEGSKGESFEYTDKKGKTYTVKPTSRTFIPARLTDNPYLMRTDYEATLQTMPEPYRSQLLYGDFTANIKGDPNQVIPTEWVKYAVNKWDELKANGTIDKEQKSSVSYGLDVAEAGADGTVLCKLTSHMVQYVIPIEADDLMAQAKEVSQYLHEAPYAPVGVDAIGVGVGLADRLRQIRYRIIPIKGSKRSTSKDATGQFTFTNLRSEIWWRMREMFDPTNESSIAIPDIPYLKQELTSIKYMETQAGNIHVESNREVRKRINRSPDYANALMNAIYVQRQLTYKPLRIV